MSKYEIMVVVDGTLKESEAKSTISELKNLLKKTDKLSVTELGLKDLSYPINKKNKAFYYVINFETSNAPIIAEFRRVTLLTKNVLRHLIINVEKDYSYKATVNPKKVAKSKFRAERYKRIKEANALEQEKVKREKDNTPVKLTDI